MISTVVRNIKAQAHCANFIAVCAAVLMAASSSGWAETTLDWSTQTSGKVQAGVMGTAMLSHVETIMLVNPSTEPPSPFPNGEFGIFAAVDGEKDSQFRIWLRMPDTEKNGSLEIPFQILEGGFSVNFGSNANVFEPKLPNSYIVDGKSAFNVVFDFDKVRVSGQIVTPGSGDAFDPAKAQVVRVEWKLEGDSYHFQVLLDGVPMQTRSGPFVHTVAASEYSAGINVCGIASRPKGLNRFFLGTIKSAGP